MNLLKQRYSLQFRLCVLVIVLFLIRSFSVSNVFAQTNTQPSLLFSPQSIETSIGDTFTTELTLDTDGASVGGVGAKIIYSPESLSIENIETLPIFPDFPAKSFDNVTGKATISGIVQSSDQLYSGKAVFAKITWKSKKAGTQDITFDFVPNSTKDSNIAVLYGTGDILQKVNSVVVHSTDSSTTLAQSENQKKNTINNTITQPVINRSFLLNIIIVTILALSQISLLRKQQQIEKKVEMIAKIETTKEVLNKKS